MKKILTLVLAWMLIAFSARALIPTATTKKAKGRNAHAQTSPAQPISINDIAQKLSIPVEKYVLDNGLTVLLAQDNTTPFVATNIWYNVGAINEQRKKTGLAHLFEHLMFEGSKHVKASEHFRRLEKAGVVDVNASTSFDRTNYYQTLPKSQLELGLSLESSRMYFLALNQKQLDEQRAVVRREREQRLETVPYGLAALKQWQSIFKKNHPFFGRVLGSHQDLEAASLADVQDFYDRFYGPSNASLALVGDFDKAEAKTLINKYFASLPKSVVPQTPSLPKVTIEKEEIIKVEEKFGRLPLVRIQYITPALFEHGDAELDLIAHILTGGEYGRLTKAITRDKHLASSTAAYQQSFEKVSIFTIDALLNPSVSEEEVVQAIDRVLADIATNPPTAIEIERARNSILTTQFFGLQNLGSQAELLQAYNRFAKNPDFIQQDIMRYNKVDAQLLQASSIKFLPVGKARIILFAQPALNHIARKGN